MYTPKKRLLTALGEALLYAFVSVVFLAFASYFTSPLTGIYGSDSGFFQMVGQAMTKGLLPYRDFFDMKGPYFFLLQYLAQLISYGRLGCFILQVINLTVSLWFGCRCIRLALKKPSVLTELLLLLPSALVLAATMDGGNLTEEFALPTLLMALYMGLRTLEDMDRPAPVGYACCYGILFGVNALSRITNAAFLCAVVFSISMQLLFAKRFQELCHNAIAFIAGVVLAFLPPVLFYASQGLLSEMLHSVFAFGVSYATEGGMIGRLAVFTRMLGWELMLLSPAVVLALSGRKHPGEWTLAVSGFVFVSLIFLLGNAYVHYFVLVIPSLVYAAFLLVKSFRHTPAPARRIGAALLLLCLFVGSLYLQKPSFTRAKTRMVTYVSEQAQYGYSRQSITGIASERLGIAASIPQDELDSVYVYGLPMDFFCQMDFFPCNKYCCWQDHYVELEPSIGQELRDYFAQTPPKWFLVRSSFTVDTLPEYFGDLTEIYEDYEVSGDFRLLRLKNHRAV